MNSFQVVAELRALLASPVPDPATLERCGRDLFDNLERGDLMIGVAPPDSLQVLADALARAGAAGRPGAWRTLAESFTEGDQLGFVWTGVRIDWPSKYRYKDPADQPVGAALRCLEEAARLGDRAAVVRFGDVSRFGSPRARRVALKLFEPLHPLTDGNDPDGTARYTYGLVLYHNAKATESVRWHEQAAAAGNADAMFELFGYYHNGSGVPADPAAARRWLQSAADLDHPRALYNLGALAAQRRDFTTAVRCYERAARAGNPMALRALVTMYTAGTEIPADPEKARRWEEVAAENGFGPELFRT